jgi:hypothetical protein
MFTSSNVEANFIIICACLPFLRHFLRRYAPKLIGEGSSAGARYFKNYHAAGSTTNGTGTANGTRTNRSWRRKQPGLSVLATDEVELAENGESMATSPGPGGGVRIVKEVQWDVTEESVHTASSSGHGVGVGGREDFGEGFRGHGGDDRRS